MKRILIKNAVIVNEGRKRTWHWSCKCQEDGREISGIYGCFEYKSDFYCKGNAVLINYVESMKDSVVVGLRCLLFCRKLVKRENIVTENIIKNHNMFSKNEFRQFIYEFRHFRKFCNKYDIIQIQSKKK